MTRAPAGWGVSRLTAAFGVVALAGAVPILAGLFMSMDHVATGALTSHSADAIAISSPLRVSGRLPLFIDAGMIIGAPSDGRGATRSGIVIDDASLTLDLSGEKRATPPISSDLDIKPGSGPLIAGLAHDSLRIVRAELTLLGPDSARARLEDVNVTITVTRKGTYKIAGVGRLGGHTLALDATWTEVALPRIPLKVALHSPVLEAVLDGQFNSELRPEFSGQAEFRLPSVKRFVKWIGLGRGIAEQLSSVVVSGPLDWTPTRMAFSRANIAVNSNQATGALTVKHADGRLSLDGTLGFQELDLGRSWPSLRGGKGAEAREPHVLTVIDADLRLSAGKVYAPAFEMGRAAVSIALSKGRLQADMAELEIEGGLAGGQVSLDLNQAEPKAVVKMKVRDVDAGRVLAAPLRRNALLGRTNLTFEGTLGGKSVGEALATVAGRGQFDLVEPGRLGIDILALMHAARDTNVTGWAAAGKGTTPVDSLTGRFRILDGAVTIETAQARTGSSMLVGSGRFDVPGRLMDFSVATGPAGAPTDPALTSKDVLLLRGTWDAPNISILRPSKPEVKVGAPVRAH
jgi:hypothetical protein